MAPRGRSTVALEGGAGSLWLRQTPDGIVVMARVAGRFPAAALSLTVKFADQVAMPPIGWHDPYGDQTCAAPGADWNGGPGPAGVTLFGADWAAACKKWEDAQILYRAELTKLFERRWVFRAGQPAGKAVIPVGDFDVRLTPAGSPVMHRCNEPRYSPA